MDDTINATSKKTTRKKTTVEKKVKEVEQKELPKRLEKHFRILVKSNAENVSLYNLNDGTEYKFEKPGFTQILTVSDITYLRQKSLKVFKDNWISLLSIEEDGYDWIQPKDIYNILMLSDYYKDEDFTLAYKKLLNSKVELENAIANFEDKELDKLKDIVENLSENEIDNLSNAVVKVLRNRLGIDL